MAWIKPKGYSKSQIDWAGEILTSESPHEANSAKAFEMLENHRASHSYPMHIFKKRLKWTSENIDKVALTAQRLKRVPSIIKKLKQEGLLIGMLSNGENYLQPYLHKRLTKYFDFSIISWQVGLRKPDPKIYRKIFEYGNWQPSQIMFIDDKKENIDQAVKLGIKSVLYQDNKQLLNLFK